MNISHYSVYIKNPILFILLGITTFFSCSSSRVGNKTEIPTLNHSKELDKYLNQSIFIFGLASNGKMGALIELRDSTLVWVDGLQNWLGKYDSKHIKVKGVLTKEEFYPMVIDDADSLVYYAGFTVLKSEFDGKPRYRYVLKDVVY